MRREGQRECGSFLISLPAQLAEKMVAFILYLGYSTRQKRPDLFDSAQDVQIASRVAVDVTAPTFNARELGDRGGGYYFCLLQNGLHTVYLHLHR